MDDKRIDELIDKALKEDMSLPDGLSDRLESKIDMLANSERTRKRFQRRNLFWLPAAAAILGAIFLFGDALMKHDDRRRDTFSNPDEAAVVAQEALAMMSRNLNKGFDKMDEAGKEMVRINNIINNQIK